MEHRADQVFHQAEVRHNVQTLWGRLLSFLPIKSCGWSVSTVQLIFLQDRTDINQAASSGGRTQTHVSPNISSTLAGTEQQQHLFQVTFLSDRWIKVHVKPLCPGSRQDSCLMVRVKVTGLCVQEVTFSADTKIISLYSSSATKGATKPPLRWCRTSTNLKMTWK